MMNAPIIMSESLDLVSINLYGVLAEKYGDHHRFAISTPREAINAMDCNFPGFRRDFLLHDRYLIRVDGDRIDDIDDQLVPQYPVLREIDIVPVIDGQVPLVAWGITALTAGAIAGTAATILASVITIGLLVGVSMLLTPKVKQKTSQKAEDKASEAKNDSYMFSGPENVTEQGVAVPIVYGWVHCGTVVISAGLEVSEMPI